MRIIGKNLGEAANVEYKKLTQRRFVKKEHSKYAEITGAIERLENLYFRTIADLEEYLIETFPQEDNHVILFPGMVNHRCSSISDVVENISKYGILASEWFGKLESEREGVFCAFIDRIHEEQANNGRGEALNAQRLNKRSKELLLFLDSNHPVMQRLLRLDFFEYERIKQESPELISSMYSEDEIEIFDKLIEPFSPCGLNMHMSNFLPNRDWSAIPGGIPSYLVNGICTKGVELTEEYLNLLIECFPTATIFTSDLQVIYTPIKGQDKKL